MHASTAIEKGLEKMARTRSRGVEAREERTRGENDTMGPRTPEPIAGSGAGVSNQKVEHTRLVD